MYIYYPLFFTNKVTNYAKIKTYGVGGMGPLDPFSRGPLVFAGGYEEHGSYTSDPTSQTFSSVSIGFDGSWTGGIGDSFLFQGDFLNQSKDSPGIH